jgi:hypothetical protein
MPRGVDRATHPATILEGASISDTVDLMHYDFVAVQMPAAWTAASLSFECSTEVAGPFTPVEDSGGTEVTYTVEASKWVIVNTAHWHGFGRFLRLRSGTSAAAVNQLADRTLLVIGSSVVG